MIKKIWEKWKKIAIKIGDFQFNLIFSLLYYILIVPIGIISNIFKDFLKLKNFPKWEKIDNQSETVSQLKNQ